MSHILTIDQIAKELNQSPFRVSYAARKACIEPAGRAGNCRIYSKQQVTLIKAALSSVRAHARKVSA